jgi:hypothetical protein
MTDTRIIWDTFLVRIWHESPGRAWRGQITHLPTETTAHFATLRQAVTFMERYVPRLAEPSAEVASATDSHGG